MEISTETIDLGALSFIADVGGDGDLVVLLHGFPHSRHTWRHELPALVDAGFSVCAPDQRGYSAGARPTEIDDYRVELLMADVLGLADARGADRFHLVGHDWGGQIGWCLAAHHPDRVRSLAVLSRPHPQAFIRAFSTDPDQAARSSHHRAHQRPEATDDWLADGASSLRSLYAAWGVPPATAATYLETLGERDALDAAINWYRAAPRSEITPGDLPAIDVPTLYVWGTADATVGEIAATGTSDFVTGPYRFEALEGFGHTVPDEEAGVFTALLLEHLAAHGRSEA
ncbi:MAG: alpha/beta hydrolase [Actinomycetota bacterium]